MIFVPTRHRITGHPIARLVLTECEISMVNEFLNALWMTDALTLDVEPTVPIESWTWDDIESATAFTDTALLAPWPHIEIAE